MVGLIRRLFNWLSDDGSCNGICYYSGPYRSGKAYYEYIMMDGMRVYEGVFKYESRYKIAGGCGALGRELVMGRFLADRKNGHWAYAVKENGRKRRLDVDYCDGIANGQYRYTEVAYRGPFNRKESVRRIELTLVEGRPVGNVIGRIEKNVFAGHTDAEGRPDGQWRMENGRRGYYESWEKGVLRSSYSVDLTTGDRKDSEPGIIRMIETFIFDECLPLERMERRGSKTWRGDILPVDVG